jgi:hypothetical protein
LWVIFALLDPDADPDPATQINADSDPQIPCKHIDQSPKKGKKVTETTDVLKTDLVKEWFTLRHGRQDVLIG